MAEGVDVRRRSNLIFGGLFALSWILFGWILLPFALPVLLGGFLVVLFLPLQDFLCHKLGGRKHLCAGLSTLLVFLLIIGPLVVTAYLVGRELVTGLEHAGNVLAPEQFEKTILEPLPAFLRRYVRMALVDSSWDKTLSKSMAGGAGLITKVLGAGTEFGLNLFLMLVAMYYFFLDGRRILPEARQLIPLDVRYVDAFGKEFRDVAYAIIYGNTVTAIIQGAIGFVGLWGAGVPHAIVWAVAMVLFAFIPIGGTALVWGPIGLVLMMTGHPGRGLFLLGWGTFLVSTVDNVIRPRLVGSRMTLHPLLVFLSMFGGLAIFGLMGLLVGPLIASIFMAMVRIYRRDFLLGPPTSPLLTPQSIQRA
jgi:predicted PurR-regulated permease PerM